MSEQERYGEEPYEPREPYAPHPPGQHATPQQSQGYDPYQGQQQGHGTGQGYGGHQIHDTGARQVYDPRYAQQGYAQQQPPPAQPGHPGRHGQPQGETQGQQTAYQAPYGGQPQTACQSRPTAERASADPAYGDPAYGNPGYGDPAYADPAYGTPAYADPAYGTPAYGNPGYGDPAYGDPAYGDPAHADRAHPDPYADRDAAVPPQRGPHAGPSEAGRGEAYAPGPAAQAGVPGAHAEDRGEHGEDGADGEEGEFHTEQFAFVEEGDEQAEDVIDWLKFSESRTERRDERKRRGRTRTIALAVVVALALGGGGTYAWKAGLIPGVGGAAHTPLSAQKRDVIVVNLRPVDSKDSSTLLLVRNETTNRGTAILVPNSLLVSDDGDKPEPLGTSVVKDGAGPTRDGLSTLFGANVQATWRLDTPFLEILVDSVGGIAMDTNATIEQNGKPLVTAGKDQSLNGKAAVAYATYRAPGETSAAQLARFGAVMRAVLMQVPSDGSAATKIIDQMGAVLDPSLTDSQLGVSLAAMSDLVKSGHYTTTTLPVQTDGTLSQQATDNIVRQILGGTVRNIDASGVPTVSVRDATTDPRAAGAAQAQVVDSGNSYVDGGKQAPRATSQVIYGPASQKPAALQLAKTLGLPSRDVVHGTGAANADITVVLGGDYQPPAVTAVG